MTSRRIKQYGVTSIFVVIFAALLFSVIAISFAGLMSRDMRRASDDELSQSAYDSALAGVEDAKRVVLAARAGDSAAKGAINAYQCDTVQTAMLAPAGDEVKIQSTSSGDGSELNQAYTCVKISLNSPDYELSIERMKSEIVPLSGVSSFDTVMLEWHKTSAAGLTAPCGAASMSLSDPNRLCPEASWGAANTTPAMLRAQTITPDASFTLDDLNKAAAGNTVFLYPGTGPSALDFGILDRYVDGNGTTSGTVHRPRGVTCAIAALSPYACSIKIELDDTVPANSELALLRLMPLYNATDIRVSLYSGSSRVNFSGVQPTVDSTGRANDLFRRVEARLSLASDVSYPEAALDVASPICKDFYVTSTTAGWVDSVHCQP